MYDTGKSSRRWPAASRFSSFFFFFFVTIAVPNENCSVTDNTKYITSVYIVANPQPVGSTCD